MYDLLFVTNNRPTKKPNAATAYPITIVLLVLFPPKNKKLYSTVIPANKKYKPSVANRIFCCVVLRFLICINVSKPTKIILMLNSANKYRVT